MNNNLKAEKDYVYELKLNYKYVNEKCFIKGNIDFGNIKNLIFYIQYKYHSILPYSILTPHDIQKILERCYGIEGAYALEVDEIIDLHLNFKENFNKEKINNIVNDYKIYDTNKLIGELRKIVDLEIEQWR